MAILQLSILKKGVYISTIKCMANLSFNAIIGFHILVIWYSRIIPFILKYCGVKVKMHSAMRTFLGIYKIGSQVMEIILTLRALRNSLINMAYVCTVIPADIRYAS